MHRKITVSILGALLLGSASAIAAPGDDIGAATRVVNLVTAEYAADHRQLGTGDNVRQDDLIEVGSDGTGEIRLRDGTHLALGPDSRLLLDEFVYNPDIDGGAIVLDLVKGAFRFVTGIAAKPAYVIRTPAASITVRGTIFDVYVQDSGLAWLLLIEGAIEVCNERGDCALHDEPGKLIRITPEGELGSPIRWALLEKSGEPFETAFPFVVAPPSFDSDPVFSADDIVGGEVPDAQEGDEEIEEADAGSATPPTPPGTPAAPLKCWNGWKEVPRGWSEKGWRVKLRRRDSRVLRCAHPVAPPHDVPVLPVKPRCIGGTVILLKTFPPRWQCACPAGAKRHQIGKRVYICKKSPVPPVDAQAECLKKGWKWTGKACVPPGKTCPKGFVGKPPLCVKLPVKCPKGFVGQPPDCKKLPPIKCPKGFIGQPPNCKKLPPIKCPKGFVGQPPNCKKLKLDKLQDAKKHKPVDKLKGLKHKLDKLKAFKKKN